MYTVICIPNECSTIRDFLSWLELHAIIYRQVMAPNMYYGLYPTTVLLLETHVSIFWVRAVCETQWSSYGSKHATQPLSDTTISASLHSWLKNYWSYMDILHIDWLLNYRICLFSVLELDVRYSWWVMAPNAHCSLFPISHLCVFTCITWKLQVICECSAYQMTALLSETFFMWFRAAWEIWLES